MNHNKRPNDKKYRKSSSSARIPSVVRIEIANKCVNPLLKINESFLTFNKNDMNLCLSCNEWKQLDEKYQQMMIELIEKNMKDYYESSSWGWNSSNKLKELSHKTSRILLLKSIESQQMIAFVNFRFETGGNDNECALYCYELQIVETHRRYGIGSYLMSCLKEIAINFNMNKVMLTVFKTNTIALNFYLNGMKYRIDKSSPSHYQQNTDYEILSIKLNKKDVNKNF